jgi:hypothetical protein
MAEAHCTDAFCNPPQDYTCSTSQVVQHGITIQKTTYMLINISLEADMVFPVAFYAA